MLMLIEVPPCRPLSKQFKRVCCAPVAQMDRALASGAKGRGFESLLARHLFPGPARTHGLHNDGNSLRVQKASGSTTTVYIVSGSKVIAEYGNGAAAGSPSLADMSPGGGP